MWAKFKRTLVDNCLCGVFTKRQSDMSINKQIQISRIAAHQTETLLLTTNHISVCAQPIHNQINTHSVEAGEQLSTKQELQMWNPVSCDVGKNETLSNIRPSPLGPDLDSSLVAAWVGY